MNQFGDIKEYQCASKSFNGLRPESMISKSLKGSNISSPIVEIFSFVAEEWVFRG